MSPRSEFQQAIDEALEESDREIEHLVRQIKYLEARLELEKAGYRCTCGQSGRHLRAVE